MKYALNSVPGLADVGDPHGNGDGPRAGPRCQGALENISSDYFAKPNNISFVKYVEKSVPGLADVWDLHVGEDCSRTPTRGSRSKKYTHQADQHEKLKG